MSEFPTPQNVTELRRFLGMTFISGFSDFANPLHRLTHKGARFDGTRSLNANLNNSKSNVYLPLCWHYLMLMETIYILYTDASVVGIGAASTLRIKTRNKKCFPSRPRHFLERERIEQGQ